ncbi:MAG: TetR/AcrR family transcriptional regulator [Ruminococcaceae bacterium]|jgi:AcrR family transcriptional regulator|nr:TetR/AcrR family transcriptional regulator [Oscillospiraceae bacterium]
MRNVEKDEIEMAERRVRMLDAGFRAFAERGIEAVSMQDVADESGLGIATVYRYFNAKSALVVAIGARMWAQFYSEVEREYARCRGDQMSAAEELDFYLTSYVVLYRGHRDILRFNQNFNGYVRHEALSDEMLRDYYAAIEPFTQKFHRLYEKGLRDGTIRTDVPERTMFHTSMHIMLAVCGRYAQGVVVHSGEPEDLTRELMLLKRMILREYVVE